MASLFLLATQQSLLLSQNKLCEFIENTQRLLSFSCLNISFCLPLSSRNRVTASHTAVPASIPDWVRIFNFFLGRIKRNGRISGWLKGSYPVLSFFPSLSLFLTCCAILPISFGGKRLI